VSLDLGGFAIHWTNTCSGGINVDVICAVSSPNVEAVQGEAPFGQRVRLHDGWIRGMPGGGVMLGNGAVIERVHLADIGGIGLRGGDESHYLGNTVDRCGIHGLYVANSSQVVGNLVNRCDLDGIRMTGGFNRVDGNVLNANRVAGVGVQPPSYGNVVTNNQLSLNGSCAINFQEDLKNAHGGNAGWGNSAVSPLNCPLMVQGGLQIACNLFDSTPTCP